MAYTRKLDKNLITLYLTNMAEAISAPILYALMLGMLITGTCNTVFLKLQNGEEYYNSDKGKNMSYNHPFFQTFTMFIGEIICLLMYAIIYYKETKKHGDIMQSPALIDAKKKGLKTDINVFILAIPACFDIIASTLMFVALTMIAASIYQMMRGLLVFVAAMMSVIFLKRRFYRHHWTALAFVVGGVAIVGASPVLYPDDDSGNTDSSNAIFGILLVVAAQLFAGGMLITEEKLLGDYYLHPLKVVGWEGFWGCFIYIILLLIMQFIPCHNDDICPYGKLEDTPQAFYEMGKNGWILAFGLGSVCSIAFFNALGLSVTKYASAAQRSTIDTSRTLLIWLVFLIKPGKGHERFIWLELVGFVLLVIGTLLFNEIIVIPLLGFNEYTKDALAKKKLEEGDDYKIHKSSHNQTGNTEDYIAPSPAHYNYQRNYRNVKANMEKNGDEGKGEKVKMEGLDD